MDEQVDHAALLRQLCTAAEAHLEAYHWPKPVLAWWTADKKATAERTKAVKSAKDDEETATRIMGGLPTDEQLALSRWLRRHHGIPLDEYARGAKAKK